MPDEPVIIGVDIGGTTVSVGRVEHGALTETYSTPINAEQSEADVLDTVFHAIDRVNSSDIKGIGCGVPGLVDAENGVVYSLTNIPAWKQVQLGNRLQERFKVPAYINNDANCFAAGVKHFGQGKPYRNLVAITLGTGLGAGLILNNRLYSGKNGGAGEYGMLPHRDRNFESYCSGQFFKNQHGTSGKELYARAMEGNPRAIDIFRAYGVELGKVIKVFMYTVDPEIIILGGSVSKAFDFFIDSLKEEIGTFEFPRCLEHFQVLKNQTPNIALLGAAALYRDSRV